MWQPGRTGLPVSAATRPARRCGPAQVVDRDAEHALDRQRRRRRPRRSPARPRRRRPAPRPGRRPRTRPGPRRTARRGRADRGAEAARDRQASASAMATPPSATSCAECSVPGADGLADRGVQRLELAEVDARERPRRRPRRAAWRARRRRATAPSPRSPARSRRPRRRSPSRPARRGVGQLADQADDRRRVDRALGALVVERDVAADDRDAERAAGVAEAGDGARELPGDVRLLGVAEVQAVGQAERLGADAGEVRAALDDGLDRAAVRVGGDAAAVAVDRDGDRGPRAVDVSGVERRQRIVGRVAGAAARRRRGLLGAADGARADDRVVLLERPAARGEFAEPSSRAGSRPDPRSTAPRAAPGTAAWRARRARGRRPGTRRPARSPGRSPTSSPSS